jgi:hypothetical protein
MLDVWQIYNAACSSIADLRAVEQWLSTCSRNVWLRHGRVLVLVFGARVNLANSLLPIAAANFLYIAIGILLPELQRKESGGDQQCKSLVGVYAPINN